MDIFLVAILLLLGGTIVSVVIQWIVEKIRIFLEIKKYIKKLSEISSEIDTIDIIDLNQRITTLSDKCSRLLEYIRKRYKLFQTDEQAKPIDYYVELEATYRRKIRKPSKAKRRYKYRPYGERY